MDGEIAVIGSANMDIGGYPAAPLKAGDSNPGRVRLCLGGVGCNIARNLALLGVKVRFATALGGDLYARGIAETLEGMGIDLSLSLRLEPRSIRPPTCSSPTKRAICPWLSTTWPSTGTRRRRILRACFRN